jgi:hypothetical protein
VLLPRPPLLLLSTSLRIFDVERCRACSASPPVMTRLLCCACCCCGSCRVVPLHVAGDLKHGVLLLLLLLLPGDE